ncbi:MAG: DNA/RNA nuclease SfsA [Deltaproteobacteria bacterium]|nr:DNA/RNA nuclease SfsA [Deltaproteobacteria bacterium]
MNFNKLTTGKLLKRYKRFLADIILDNGSEVTAHVPNTGSMKSTNEYMSEVALSYHPDPKRKLKWTLELIKSDNCWVGVNTSFTNRMAESAIMEGKVQSLKGYAEIRREVKYGENSRVDLVLLKDKKSCFVEVKNVTWKDGDFALFPDAVTKRGTKHLEELMNVVKQGDRAVMLFVVNRSDVNILKPAIEIDPVYSKTLKTAAQSGVELIACRFKNSLEGFEFDGEIPIIFD